MKYLYDSFFLLVNGVHAVTFWFCTPTNISLPLHKILTRSRITHWGRKRSIC